MDLYSTLSKCITRVIHLKPRNNSWTHSRINGLTLILGYSFKSILTTREHECARIRRVDKTMQYLVAEFVYHDELWTEIIYSKKESSLHSHDTVSGIKGNRISLTK